MYQEVNLTGNKLASKKLTGIIGISGGGTKDYNALNNKPSINGITLSGNKTGSDLGLVDIAKVSSAIVHGRAKGASPSFYTDIDDLPISRFITDIVAVQAGSGTPSPSNPRAISGYADVVIKNDVQGATQATYTIALGSTVYGGILDVTKGVLTVTHGMVDLGTLSYTQNNHQTFGTYYYANVQSLGLKRQSDYTKAFNNICDKYAVVGRISNDFVDLTLTFDGNNSTVLQVQIKNSNCADATAMQTALNGVKLVYELATPITIQLTPTEVRTLLGENNIYANSGDVDILYYVTLGGMINE